MGLDETGTRTCFNDQLDNIVRLPIDAHQGRLVKTMGGGFLVEFGSLVKAAQGATDIQNDVTIRQKAEADDHKMLLRMGVHLGGVLVEVDDIDLS